MVVEGMKVIERLVFDDALILQDGDLVNTTMLGEKTTKVEIIRKDGSVEPVKFHLEEL